MPLRLAEAEASIRQAIAQAPLDYPLHNLLGVILKNRGRTAAAIETLERAHALGPANAAPLSYIVNIHLASRNGPRAIDVARRLIAAHPAVAEHQRQFAAAAFLIDDHALALQHLTLATTIAPTEPQPWIDAALYAEQAGSIAPALAWLDRGVAAAADSVALAKARAGTMRRAAQDDAAILWLEQHAAIRPDQTWILLELARCRLTTDRRRANADLRKALAIEPDNPEILMELADSLNPTRGAGEDANIAEAYGLAKRRIAVGRVGQRDAQMPRNILNRSCDFEAAARLGSFEELGTHWAATGQISALHYRLAQATRPDHRHMLLA